MKKRVVVAMSGGVDSSVAAALLQRKGYEVIGMTMCFSLPDSSRKRPNCCGLSGIEDARRVAQKLGIRHYVVPMQKHLEELVIKDFCREYLSGRTPNPCVRCNQYLKFEILLKKALSLGATYLATGHYARIVKCGNSYQLKKAKDLSKDQSYFLYRLNQEQLKRIIFPLGIYTKTQVRGLARKFDLAVSEKPGSQDVCFIPDSDYHKFLKSKLGREIKPGPIKDAKGDIIGTHKGIAYYTIGQRGGLGIARGYPVHVTSIDPEDNSISVGRREDTLNSELLLREVSFINKPAKNKIAPRVRIRYNHKETKADIRISKDSAQVIFRHSQFAVTPGQSAVFYDKDRVIGGGIIGKVGP